MIFGRINESIRSNRSYPLNLSMSQDGSWFQLRQFGTSNEVYINL